MATKDLPKLDHEVDVKGFCLVIRAHISLIFDSRFATFWVQVDSRKRFAIRMWIPLRLARTGLQRNDIATENLPDEAEIPAPFTLPPGLIFLLVRILQTQICNRRFGLLVIVVHLEAQQRYFSYRAILAAIVSQSSFVLAFGGIAQLSRDTFQNGVSHRLCLCEVSTKGGYRTIFGEC